MRVFLTVLVLIFSLQSWTKAEDISDFEIEGIGIGDSLLDFFSINEIESRIVKEYYKYKSDKKFVAAEFYDKPFFEIYKDGIQIHIKSNDKKYKIYGISGNVWYEKNINDCYKKQKEIDKDLSNTFKNAERQFVSKSKHQADKSGKSNVTYVTYWFKSGDYVSIDCTDWSIQMSPRTDNLSVSLITKELNDWLISD